MDTRKSAWYWVKYDSKWMPASFTENQSLPWELIGSDEYYGEDAFDEIGDTIEIPEKYQ